MSDIIKLPAEAKEIVKHKRTGKVYASKDDFDADVADPNTDTTVDDFRQDLESKLLKLLWELPQKNNATSRSNRNPNGDAP